MAMTKEQENNLGIDPCVDKPCDCGSWMIWICRGCGKKEKFEG